MSTSTPSSLSVPRPVRPAAAAGRTPHRGAAVERLLDGLEALVARHRALTSQVPENQSLHAELIGAEIAHELAIARADLRRPGHLSVVERPAEGR